MGQLLNGIRHVRGAGSGAMAKRLKRSMLFALAMFASIIATSCSKPSPQLRLEAAILRGDIAEVESLLDDVEHVDVNWRSSQTGTSVLYTAAAYDRRDIVRLLLQRGARPNIATVENETPLLAAAYSGNTEVAGILIEAGADVNAAETRYGYSPLTYAAAKGHAAVVRLLLDAGADRNARIQDGRTAMVLARQRGYREIVQLLMTYQPTGRQTQ